MATDFPISPAAVELLDAEVWAQLHGEFAAAAGPAFALVKRVGRATILASPAFDVVAINRAMGFGFDEPFNERQLSEIREFFREHGTRPWFIEYSPHASMDPAMLVAAGGEQAPPRLVKLASYLRGLPSLRIPAMDIREVHQAEASLFMDLVGSQLGVPEPVRPGIASTIGRPGWRYYFVCVDDKPVAGAALFTSGEGAWLGMAGTLPEYRNRGIQTALLAKRIEDAVAVGCAWVSAEAFAETVARNPSLHNMKRFGLLELYQKSWYRFHGGADRAEQVG
jgi:GNAT superfamily N-acetyltransferase